MGPLRNQRHERYALAVAEGHSISESYRLAGYQKNTGNASRLNANESIQARVAELQQQTAASSRITIESICAELAEATAVAKSKGQAQAGPNNGRNG
jgi:phage terminase small subunit